jgi:hypothetical protein
VGDEVKARIVARWGSLVCPTTHVVRALGYEPHGVVVEMGHVELRKIGLFRTSGLSVGGKDTSRGYVSLRVDPERERETKLGAKHRIAQVVVSSTHPERDLRVVAPLPLGRRYPDDDRLLRIPHVVPPDLREPETALGVEALDRESLAEDIRELRAVSVPTAGGLPLVVVEVGTLVGKSSNAEVVTNNERGIVQIYDHGTIYYADVVEGR